METGSSNPLRSSANRRQVAAAAAAAAAVEWYDYFVFGIAAALIFSEQFFPSISPVAGVLASFATFAVGFLARPLGGIIAGNLGDKHGRKPMLVLALTIMGISTVLIGLLPSYTSIGILAPISLVVLRLFQGIAVGAQWGGAMLLATEYAPPGKKGLYGSFVQLGVPISLVFANCVFLVTAGALPPDGFAAWGWRVPFLLGGFVLVLAWYIHRRVQETPEFRRAEAQLTEAESRRKSPLSQVLRNHSGTVLLAAGSFIVNHAVFYIGITGVLDYATRHLGMPRNTVLAIVLVGSVLQLGIIPASAILSDRIGRVRVYAFGIAGLLVWAIPMFLLIDTRSVAAIAVALFVSSTFLSIMYGPQAALFSELFDPEVRYTGASLGYQISGVLGGGLAPFLMVLLLESTHTSLSVSIYMMVLAGIALISIAFLAHRAHHRQSVDSGAEASKT
jgi:MFS family permease